MKLAATYSKKELEFTERRYTSRGSLAKKTSFFITVKDIKNNKTGIGECSYLQGLSPELFETYEQKIQEVCDTIDDYNSWLTGKLDEYPSIQLGLETAVKDLASTNHILFDTPFARGEQPIIINGLIWMQSFEKMKQEADDKIAAGFNCIKLKIGAIDFKKELELLAYIRSKSSDLTLRVDANGAFTPNEALDKLKALAKFNIHSIEQPIKAKQWEELKKLCATTPLPIALDEELIGVNTIKEKTELLNSVKPQYLVLKPSLTGGFKGTSEWIKLAQERGIDWWITSCLETNIGLNAIAQFVSTYDNSMPQGLGTGKIYTNNVPSGLSLNKEELSHIPTNWTEIHV